MSRLKEQYDSQIKAAMMKKFGYKNEMQIPKLVKIVVNMGVGDAKENHKLLDSAIGDMEKITGQKAVVCKAKKSVANFKLREGTNSLIVLLTLLYHVYVTLEVLTLTHLTEEETTLLVLKSS